MKHTIDFRQGCIMKKMIVFALPILLSELCQNLYNSVDALVVGNYVSKDALAAVSVCNAISMLLIGFFNGMSVGVSVVVSRIFGGKKPEELPVSMRVTFSFGAFIGILASAIGILSAPWLLQLAGCDGEVYQQALVYLRIFLAGIMFTVIYNIGAGLLRAIGNPASPFYILVFACVINIILDIFLVASMQLGIAGAAIATVISQGISVLLIYCKLIHTTANFHFTLRELRQYPYLLWEVINIGVPSGLQSSLISISNLFIWRYINLFDSAVGAGIGVAQRLDKFVSMPCKSFGLTMTTFVSQNAAAENKTRIQRGFVQCISLGLGVTIGLSITVFYFAPQCVALFNPESAVIGIGTAMMRTIIPFYFFMTIRETVLGLLRGYGDAHIPMVISLFGMIVIRQVFLSISMRLQCNVENIYYCYPLSWGITTILLLLYLWWKTTKKDPSAS